MTANNENFKTWTFDQACKEMDQNVLHRANISVTSDLGATEDSDLIIFGVFGSEEVTESPVPQPVLTGQAKNWDEVCNGSISELMVECFDSLKHGATLGSASPTLRVVAAGSKTKKIAIVGLGSGENQLNETAFGKIGSVIASKCDETKAKTCSVCLSLNAENAFLTNLSCEFYNSLYSDNRYRTGDNKKHCAANLETVTIVAEGGVTNVDAAMAAIETGKALASGVTLTKDIVNAPHNVLNSESLADVARKIAEESGGTIKCTILGKEECEKRGMGAYLGVARGSETEPQFIHLTYSPKSGNVKKKVGVVGKGLLFDTGGYNIKTAMMELMKFDCGGAAAILGAARAVGALEPEGVEAHFIVAACENMISDRAYVPSDILTASNGKTIEVLNTDAEGRLTLADALVYADKEVGCESIIELSTLTGACMVSLGKKVCGVWTSNDDLANDIAEVSKMTGEKSWRMPLENEYNEQLKSLIADIKNIGTRYGGAITAALFLQNFVDKKKPFAHIDIAGPVWDDKSGATGFGAKLVQNWISMQGS